MSGGLVALGGDEALEEQAGLDGIDLGDAEHEADGGVCGGTAALAEDVSAAGEAHDGMDGEEIGGVAEAADEGQFVAQLRLDLGREAAGIAKGDAVLPDQPLQRLLRRLAGAVGLVSDIDTGWRRDRSCRRRGWRRYWPAA